MKKQVTALEKKLGDFWNFLYFKEREAVTEELDEQIWKRTRIYMYVTASLVAIWGIFDVFIDFKNLWIFLALRVIYTPITFIFAYYFYLPSLRKNHKKWAFIHYLLLITDIGIMVLWTDHFVKYLIGFSTIFWGASVVMLWRFWNTVIPGLIVTLIAAIRFYFFPHGVEPGEFITGLYYFMTCLVFTSVISAYGYWSAYQLSEKNITLKETQDKLIKAEKMAGMNMLVASVAHEINTPVGTAITAASHVDHELDKITDRLQLGEVTLDELLDPATDSKASIASVLNELHRTAELVDRFKETAIDQTMPDSRKFELTNYLENNIINVGLQQILKRSNIQVNVNKDQDIKIDSYPGEFSRIFTNLIMNSVIHGYPDKNLDKEPGNITITLNKIDNGDIKIHYQDDGIGMSEEILNRVFDPFFTTKGTDISNEGRGQKGSGLGMSIVYNIVTQILKGKIEAHSKEGKGAKFIITFPFEHKEPIYPAAD